MKKEDFKKIVKERINEKASEFLDCCQEKHSKTSNLKSYAFQDYLTSSELRNSEKKLLFSLRTRSIEVKRNYNNKSKFNMKCSLCKDPSEDESEIHLLQCPKILGEIANEVDTTNSNYMDIFRDNLQKQVTITRIFDNVFKTKKILLQNQT
jgi:predicted O-linked N-acetylglucosamine transferase (SPINDLY family)